MRKKLIIFFSMFSIFILNPTTVFAGIGEEIGEAMNNITGWISGVFFDIIVGIADGLADILKNSKLTIDDLMKDKSPLSFKFEDGNMFSDNALKIYEILAEVVIVFMVILFVVVGIRFMLARTKQQFDTAKNYTKTFIISLFALLLSIYFLRYVFAIRGVIIDVITNAFWKVPQQQSLADKFRYELVGNPQQAKSLVNAGLYFGFQLVTVWFAFSYAGVSFSIVILIALLPIMLLSLNSNRFKRMFDNWTSEFISAFTVPIIDVILFNIVLLLIPNTTALVKLLFVSMIMPTRNFARKLMGSSGGAMEGSSIGLLIGATNLAKSVAHTAVSTGVGTVSGIKEANEMQKTGEFYAQQAPLATSGSSMSGVSGGPSYTTSPEFAQLAISTGNKDMLSGLSNSDKAFAYTQMAQQRRKQAIVKGITQGASSVSGAVAGAGMGAWFGLSGVAAGAGMGADIGLAASPVLSYFTEKGVDAGVGAFNLAEPLITPRLAPVISPFTTPIKNMATNVYAGASNAIDTIRFAYNSALVSPYKKAIDNSLLDTSSEEYSKYISASDEPFLKTGSDISAIASNLYTQTFGTAPTPEVQANLTTQIQTMLKTDDNAFYKKSQLESLNGLKNFYKNGIVSKVGKPVNYLDDILNAEFGFDDEISRLESELSAGLPTTLHLAGGKDNPTLGTIDETDLASVIGSLSATFNDSSTPEHATYTALKNTAMKNQVNSLKSGAIGLYINNFRTMPTSEIQAKLESQIIELCSGVKGDNFYTKSIEKEMINNEKSLYLNSLGSRISMPIADIEKSLDMTYKFDERILLLQNEISLMSQGVDLTGSADNPIFRLV